MTKAFLKLEDALAHISGRVARQYSVAPENIDLSDPDNALELTQTPDAEGFLHVLRYETTTETDCALRVRHGIKLGRNQSRAVPADAAWNGRDGSLDIVCDIFLGETLAQKDPASGRPGPATGQLNADPLLIVNFEIETRRFSRQAHQID